MNIKKSLLENELLLSLVIPVYNEEEAVQLFLNSVTSVFKNQPSIHLEFVFVNDGSTDETLEKLLDIQKIDSRIKVVDLSRNFGKEAALTAGLNTAKGDIVVPIDVDLQDPPELILTMIEKWREGYDVVLARRINRDSDTWVKRTSANWFYKIHNIISNPKIPKNVGDFRLIDRRVVNELQKLTESHRFMKGLFAWLGFRECYVDYIRPERIAGTSKFKGWKLWNFAIEGITSFSIIPLQVWSYFGFFISFLSFIFGFFIILKVFILGVDVPGYASLLVLITFFGGLQLIGIGVIGEYVGRTYIESKRRPSFLIREIYQSEGKNGSQRNQHTR